jgi:predicted 2-oxoglutarate/Fe(II)-dependent dioxygenase YbiX
VLRDVVSGRQIFDDRAAIFFGVSTDPRDESEARVQASMPGIRFFWDFDRNVSKLYGVARDAGDYRKATFVLDPALRILAVVPFSEGVEGHFRFVSKFVSDAVAQWSRAATLATAPVLIVPYVFERGFCRSLINYYDRVGGGESGHMTERGGMTVGVIDYGMKRRRDARIDDNELAKACTARLEARLKPAIRRAYQFNVTRLERHIVSCYDAAEGGYFHAHRDNTTAATAYRRFAVSLFLNTGEYEGGQLRFPEFGPKLYTAPPGGAVVFSCSLLHEATPVTRGKRYMYLPFLFDDAAAAQREECLLYLSKDPDQPL